MVSIKGDEPKVMDEFNQAVSADDSGLVFLF